MQFILVEFNSITESGTINYVQKLVERKKSC